MTTEEMNREIALYDGYEQGWWIAHEKKEKTFCRWDGKDDRCFYAKDFKYHRDWSSLMPVWSKLRGELEGCMNARTNKYITVDGAATHLGNIKVTILIPDIQKAHQLIHAAIVWLKSK